MCHVHVVCMHACIHVCMCMHACAWIFSGRYSAAEELLTTRYHLLTTRSTVTTPYHPLPRFTPPYQVEKEQTKLLRAISHRLEKIEQKLDDQQEDIASLHSEQPAVRLPLQLPLQPSLQLPLYPAAAFAAAPVAIPATTHAPWNHLCSRVSLPCSYRLCVHISAPLQPA